MLNREQIEFVHREIDGANTPEESARFRSMMEVEPPAHLRRAILEALPPAPRASANPIRSIVAQLRLITEAFMTRRTMIYGGAALAIVILVASVVTDFPPLGGTAGSMVPPGVQQASRYRGRVMTAADVTLENPEIKVLLQNDRILRLVQSNAFRQVMNNEAFRELQNSEAYRALMDNEAFRQLQNSEEFRALMSTEAYRELQNSEAYHELMNSEAYRELADNEAFRQLQNSEAYHELMNSEAYRELADNEAFRQLQNSEAFRSLSRNLQLSELFMNLTQ